MGFTIFLVSFFDLNQTHCSLAQIIINDPNWERKVMQRTVRYSAIAAIIPASLLSVVFLISAVHYNVAQARSRHAAAVACGQELKKLACEGKQHARVPSKGSGFPKMLRTGAPRCAHV
jgi:hypothetical protein